MNELDLMAPSKVAKKYGGDKRKIAEAARMGRIDPTVAVMAGMFIDRMRGAAAKEQQPQTTVAQDVMAPAGVAAAAASPVDRGLTALPAADQLYSEDSFAGGGIIAFQGGGLGSTFDEFTPGGSEYDEFSSYQPLFPSFGEGNRRYALKQLGYTNEQIANMSAAQQEFVLQNINKTGTTTTTPTAAPPKKEEGAPPAKESRDSIAPKVDVEKADKAVTDYAKKVRDINKEFGVSETPDAEARAAIEKYRAKLTQDLDKAGALGLIQAGLGIAGGKSQHALQNIGQGAEKAVGEYGRALEKIRGEEKGLLESEVKLAQADDARRRGDAKLALDLEKEANSLAVQERRAVAAEKQAARPSQVAEYIEFFRRNPEEFGKFMELQKPGFESAQTAKQKAVATEFTQLYGTKFMQLSNSKKPEDQAAAKKMLIDFYTSRGVAPPMSGAGSGAAGAVDTSNPLLK